VSLSVLLSPAPGWYPDPAGAATYRWWDGDAWTEGTHAGQTEAAEPATAAPETFAPATAAPETFAPAAPAPLSPEAFTPETFTPIALFADPAPVVEPARAAGPGPVADAPLPPSAPAPGPATASTRVVRRGVSPAKTRWVSILSAYPFVYPFAVGMIVALGYAGGAATNTSTLIVIGAVAAIVLLAPAWMIADSDRKELRARGYEPAPSMAWMLLLPPIAYLIARRRLVGPTY
jgi:hypothetical protein